MKSTTTQSSSFVPTGRCDGCGYVGPLEPDGEFLLCSVCRAPWPTRSRSLPEPSEVGRGEQPVAAHLEADPVLAGQVGNLALVEVECLGHHRAAEELGSHGGRSYPIAEKKVIVSLGSP